MVPPFVYKSSTLSLGFLGFLLLCTPDFTKAKAPDPADPDAAADDADATADAAAAPPDAAPPADADAPEVGYHLFSIVKWDNHPPK